ncbi:MAG: hypothetical protein ACYDCL_10210 [Myxococcales bacterium]
MGTNTNVKANPTKYQASVAKLMAGFNQAFPAKSSIVVNGTALTAAQIVAKLQPILDEYQAILDARSTLQGDLQTAKANRPAEHELIMQLHAALISFFGRNNPELLQFGFTPTKPKQKKATAKVTAAAKAKATRELRHTLGSVQKQDVKYGVVPTSVSIVDGKASIAEPSAPSEPQSSAAAPGPGNSTTSSGS